MELKNIVQLQLRKQIILVVKFDLDWSCIQSPRRRKLELKIGLNCRDLKYFFRLLQVANEIVYYLHI